MRVFHLFCALPDAMRSCVDTGLVARAREKKALEVILYDLHYLSPDPHGKIDDCPYGGGPGMVLRVDVVAAALERVFGCDAETLKESMPVILLSPRGERFTQRIALELLEQEEVVLICGRYEGIDERVSEHIANREISMGDFILSGGEIAAAAVVDAVARLIPQVVGNVESLKEESFSGGLLEYPQYTRPADFRGWKVPRVLLSGNHAEIQEWRKRKALEITREKRPDLLGGRVEEGGGGADAG